MVLNSFHCDVFEHTVQGFGWHTTVHLFLKDLKGLSREMDLTFDDIVDGAIFFNFLDVLMIL
jgi:hypothetical protein